MSARLFKTCAFILALAMVPGAAEILESAVHLATKGHLAHAAPDGDHHDPAGPEHGCTPTFHSCGCHASVSFLGPQRLGALSLGDDLFEAVPVPASQPDGFWPAVERPPRV